VIEHGENGFPRRFTDFILRNLREKRFKHEGHKGAPSKRLRKEERRRLLREIHPRNDKQYW
jgi:hypothetical protein